MKLALTYNSTYGKISRAFFDFKANDINDYWIKVFKQNEVIEIESFRKFKSQKYLKNFFEWI